MRIQDITATIQAIGAVGGLLFAFLSWWKGRQNEHKIKSVIETVQTVSAKADSTHELVNGQSELLRTAAYAKGVTDQKTDARDAIKLARDLAADAAQTKKANGGGASS